MSLVKSPKLTEKRLAAMRWNAQLSRGPTTPEGLERTRAVKLRHGWYSRLPEAAFRGLWEDPGKVVRNTCRLLDMKRQERQMVTAAKGTVRPPAEKKKYFGVSCDVAEK